MVGCEAYQQLLQLFTGGLWAAVPTGLQTCSTPHQHVMPAETHGINGQHIWHHVLTSCVQPEHIISVHLSDRVLCMVHSAICARRAGYLLAEPAASLLRDVQRLLRPATVRSFPMPCTIWPLATPLCLKTILQDRACRNPLSNHIHTPSARHRRTPIRTSAAACARSACDTWHQPAAATHIFPR